MTVFVLTGKDGKRYDVDAASEAEGQAQLDAAIPDVAPPDSAPALSEHEPSMGEYAMDVLRSVGQGLRSAHEGIVGGGGDIYNLLQAGTEWAGEKVGAPEGFMQSVREAKGKNWLPTGEDVAQSTSPILGEPYQSTTGPGQVMQTAGEYAANPSKGFFRNVVAPTIGTEVGGAVGEAYGNETLGRLLGGGSGGASTGLAMRGITGPQVSSERARLTKLLTDKGVDLTGGQVSGSKGLRYAETGPYETKPANIKEKQSRQFNRAALKEAGIDADEVTPDVLDAADAQFSQRYDDVVSRAGGIPLDPDLETALLSNVMDFERLTDGNKAVTGYFKRISDAAKANGDTIPPDVFQQISSEISRDLRKLRGNPQGNAELMETLREFRSSMFDSIGRNGRPEVVDDWKNLNRQYRNYKDIERAMYGAGEATKEGMITPGKLGSAVSQGDKAGTLREKGDLSGQAKAGQMLMTDLPQSGTTPRLLVPGTLALMANQLGSQDLKGAALTGVGAAAFPAVSSALTSKPARTALIRQATNPLPVLDKRTAALAAMLAPPPQEDEKRRRGQFDLQPERARR